MSKISIIIPLYNSINYLQECIESVISQSFSDWELIIINDGSTDRSGEMATNFALEDERINVFYSENMGPSTARNQGLDHAKSNFILFLDSDDYLFPDALKDLYSIILETEADIVEGIITRKVNPKRKNIIKIKEFNAIEALENTLLQKKLLSSPCGKLYKKSLFDSIRFRQGIFYEDLDIIYRLFAVSNKIVFIDKPVYFYRKTPGSRIRQWNIRRSDVLNVTEEMEGFILNNFPQLFPAARERRLSANFNIFCLASNHKEIELADSCWELIKRYRSLSLKNPRSRLKNKLGATVSYLGRDIFSILGKLIYN